MSVGLENECAAKTALEMIYFFNGGLQEYFVLSSGSLPACCRDMSGAKISLAHEPCCSLQLYSQPWVVTLHFLVPSFHSQCFKHCNTVMMSCGFYLSLTGPVVSLSQLRTPPFFPTHIHTKSAWKTNTFMSYCICEIKSLPSPNSTQIFTVDSQVLGQLSWRELTSVLLLTHVTNEKRDKRDFHIKGWRAHLQFLKRLAALGSPEYTGTETHMYTFGSHKKKFFVAI